MNPSGSKNIYYCFIALTICCSLIALFATLTIAAPSESLGGEASQSVPAVKYGQDPRELERAADKILKQAENHLKKSEFWLCAQELIIIMDYYQSYSQLDKVVHLLGLCLLEEQLYTASIRMYNFLLKKFPKSQYLADALLGLEKAFYAQQEHKQALRVYYVIIKKSNQSKILDEARYVAGQCHYQLKNYDMAINILKDVSNQSEFYDSALYTIAISYLKKSNVATSVDYFRNIISLPVISAERRKIVDNARLTLGLIYYELRAYQAANHQLSKISSQHENYQDALLGMSWSHLKLNEYENVIKTLDKLIKEFPGSENAEESYFLLGQAHIALGNYNDAIAAYRRIVELFPDRQSAPGLIKKVSHSLRNQQNQVEELKVQILIEETKLLDAIPLNGYGEDLPKYLVEEKQRLHDFRKNMIQKLLAERDQLLYMQRQIADLLKTAERHERRKDWRGYAEYGISRALFLREIGASRGN